MKGFTRREPEYNLIHSARWIYDLGMPALNFHVGTCVEKKMSYIETLECLIKILARENKLLEKIIINKNIDLLALQTGTVIKP